MTGKSGVRQGVPFRPSRGESGAPAAGRRATAWLRLLLPAAAAAAAFLALLALLLAAAPAAAQRDAACDPRIADALADAARRGVDRDAAIVRHPAQGVRDPESILDLSCAGELFDYRAFNVFFDPGRADILGLAKRQVCRAAREAYGRYLGRPLGAHPVPRLPELRLPGLRAGGGEPASPRPPPGERFRQLMGGQ